MNKLTIVSPAFYSDPSHYKMLVNSCNHFGLNLYLYGVNEPWTWLTDTKVFRLIEEIENIDSEYIMICDADDAFVMANEKEILYKYHSTSKTILVSADRQQDEGDSKYPQSIFRERYPLSATPWRYCNSGGYIGEKDKILDLLSKMATVKHPDFIPVYRSKDWSNDQFRMSIVFLRGYPLTVDTHCNVFQTMGCIEPGEIKWRGNYFMNKVTGTFPCVIHFNGKAPGIKEAYEKCFELQNCINT